MMSDCDDMPVLVDSSDDEFTDRGQPQNLHNIAEKWLKKGSQYVERQELWMRIFCMGPFLFGVNNILPVAWIKALVSAKLLLNENRQYEITYFEWPEWECLDLMDFVITEVQKSMRDLCTLCRSLDCIQKLDTCENGVVLDVDRAIAEAENVIEITSVWRRILNDQVVTKKEKEAKFAVLYVLRMYHEHVIYFKKSSDFVERTKKVHHQIHANLAAEEFKRNGNDNFNNKRFMESIQSYTEAAKLVPFHHAYYGNRAQAYLELNMFREALGDGRRAVMVKPDFLKGYYRYAKALNSLGQLDTAIKVNRKALNLCKHGDNERQSLENQRQEFTEARSERDNPLTPIPKALAATLASLPVESSDHTDITETLGFKDNVVINRKNKQEPDVPEMVSSDSDDAEDPASWGVVTLSSSNDGLEETLADVILIDAPHCNSIDRDPLPAVATEDKQNMSQLETAKFMSLLHDGSESMLKHVYHDSMNCYRKALDMMSETKKFGMDNIEMVVLKYAFAMAALSTSILENIQHGIEILLDIIKNYTHVRFPVAYFGLGKAYTILNRYTEAIEQLKKGLIACGENCTMVSWPGTNTLIEETDSDVLKKKINELIELCEVQSPAEIYIQTISTDSNMISQTDPDIKVCNMSSQTDKTFKLESEEITAMKEARSKKPGAKQKATSASKLAKKQEKKDRHKQNMQDNVTRNKSEDQSGIIDGKSAVAFIEDMENIPQPLPELKDLTILRKDDADKQRGSLNEKNKKSRRKRSKNKQTFSDKSDGGLFNEPSTISGDEASTSSKSCSSSVPGELKSQTNNSEKSFAENVKHVNKNDETSKHLNKHDEMTKNLNKRDEKAKLLNKHDEMTKNLNKRDETAKLLNKHDEITKNLTKREEPAKHLNKRDEMPKHLNKHDEKAKHVKKHDELTEILFSFFEGILDANGPLAVDDSKIVWEIENFPPEANDKIQQVGGLAAFLRQSLNFAIIGDVISLMSDSKRAREIALLRRNGKKISTIQTSVQNLWTTVSNSAQNTDSLSENTHHVSNNMKPSVNVYATLPHSSSLSISTSLMPFVTASFTDSVCSNSSYVTTSLQSQPLSSLTVMQPASHWSLGASSFTVNLSPQHTDNGLDSRADILSENTSTSYTSANEDLDDDIELNILCGNELNNYSDKFSLTKSAVDSAKALTDCTKIVFDTSHSMLTTDVSDVSLNTHNRLDVYNVQKYSTMWEQSNNNDVASWKEFGNEINDKGDDNLMNFPKSDEQFLSESVLRTKEFIQKYCEKPDYTASSPNSKGDTLFPQPVSPMERSSPFYNNNAFDFSSPWQVDHFNNFPSHVSNLFCPTANNKTSEESRSSYNLFSGPNWGFDSFNNKVLSNDTPSSLLQTINSPYTCPHPIAAAAYRNSSTNLSHIPPNEHLLMSQVIGPPSSRPRKMDKETQIVCKHVTASTMTDLYEPYKHECLHCVNELGKINKQLKAHEQHAQVLAERLSTSENRFNIAEATWNNERNAYTNEINRLSEQITFKENREKELTESIIELKKMVNEITKHAINQRESDMIELNKYMENEVKCRRQLDIQMERAKIAELEILQTHLHMAKSLSERSLKEAQYHHQGLQGFVKKLEDDNMTIPRSTLMALDDWSITLKNYQEHLGKLQEDYEKQICEVIGGKSLSQLSFIRCPSPPIIQDSMKGMILMQQCPPPNLMMPSPPFLCRPPVFSHPGIPSAAVETQTSKSIIPTSSSSSSSSMSSSCRSSSSPIAQQSTTRPLILPSASASSVVITPLRPPTDLRGHRTPLNTLGTGNALNLPNSYNLFLFLQRTFPNKSGAEIQELIKELFQINGGSLSSLTMEHISSQIMELVQRKEQRNKLSSSGKQSTPFPAHNNNRAAFHLTHQSEDQLSATGKGMELSLEEEDLCVICHEEMNVKFAVKLGCGHNFHDECIRKWFHQQSTCPNCRVYSLLSDEFPSLT